MLVVRIKNWWELGHQDCLLPRWWDAQSSWPPLPEHEQHEQQWPWRCRHLCGDRRPVSAAPASVGVTGVQRRRFEQHRHRASHRRRIVYLRRRWCWPVNGQRLTLFVLLEMGCLENSALTLVVVLLARVALGNRRLPPICWLELLVWFFKIKNTTPPTPICIFYIIVAVSMLVNITKTVLTFPSWSALTTAAIYWHA